MLPVTAAILLICIAGMAVIYFLSVSNKNIFLILPNETSALKIDIDKIDDFNQNEFPLTYEIPGSERISLLQREYPVTITATTGAYRQILGLSMKTGSFFTAQAWTGKLRNAVLNEKAAFTIFGSINITGSSFRMRNETWLVTGVITDNDDEICRVYVPSSVIGGETNAMAANTTDKLDQTYLENSLKLLGIRNNNYDFYNFGIYNKLFLERILVIVLTALSLLLLSLLKPLISIFLRTFGSLKKDLGSFYIAEILKKMPGTVLRFILTTAGLIISPVLAIIFLIKLVSICLPWQDIPFIKILSQQPFYNQLAALQRLDLISLGIFILSLVITGVFFARFIIAMLKKK